MNILFKLKKRIPRIIWRCWMDCYQFCCIKSGIIMWNPGMLTKYLDIWWFSIFCLHFCLLNLTRFYFELFFFTVFFTLCVAASILKREYWNHVLTIQDSWNLTQANQSSWTQASNLTCLHQIQEDVQIMGVSQNKSNLHVHITPECSCFYRDLIYTDLTAFYTVSYPVIKPICISLLK